MIAARKLALVALMTLGAGSALADNQAGMTYIAPMFQGVWVDDLRGVDDDHGAQLSFGRVLTPRWNLELGLSQSDHGGPAGNDLTLQTANLSLLRVSSPESRATPYLIFGAGWQRQDPDSGQRDTSLAVDYGLGFLADLTSGTARKLQLRGEIKGRRALKAINDDDEAIDYIAGIGLQFMWGGTPAREEPAPVADSDGDGVPDDADKCPDTPAGTAVNAEGCELDSDGDGVADGADKCPGTPAGAKVDPTGCEIDEDADDDGVADASDKCPNTPAGTRVDANGCPITAEIRLERIFFDTGLATLREESAETLDFAVRTLNANPDLAIEVAGHTDNQGPDALNLDLSERRAQAVLDYLRDKGVKNRMTAKGYGESEPIADNATRAGRQENRRVVLRVLD
jgi:OOP family OmpA-OmpF porin